ncbi:hypothetical protein KM92DES2_20477 [uncultured Desulfovibrio sp.]|uniref:Uncharacterized protein n=1 Tax=uncultured Desulfovibrio sp. TaxID=167968 RepID=A0A212KL01_9BACT|nr:hypothetical protein KM92DES2_20477 [uncultured Desulfovibrio sp.]
MNPNFIFKKLFVCSNNFFMYNVQ